MRIFSYLLIIFIISGSVLVAQNKFVGVKTCSMCHKKPEQGEQLKIWEQSAHANAFKTLQTEEADKIAAGAGFGKAAEAKECLVCHVTGYDVDAGLKMKNFKMEEGVQCETCHGAGSEYKSKKVMEDRAASIAAGMTEYKDEEAIKKQCLTCHNDKSPTYKSFDFKASWAKIAHPVPKEG